MASTNFPKDELASYTHAQLNHFFPDGKTHLEDIRQSVPLALDRIQFSLRHVKLDGYRQFSHLHSDLYAQYIYYLSNTVWNNTGNRELATKLFYLNKSLHGLNCMYDTVLPDIFILIHCVGTVLGKATYSDYFVCCQNTTVGSDKGRFPQIKGPLYMGPGSAVIGNSSIGAFTHISIGATLLDTDTNDDALVIGKMPDLQIRPIRRNLLKEIYFTI